MNKSKVFALLAAAIVAFSMFGASIASAAKTYGGIYYFAVDPFRSGDKIWGNFHYDGTATVTGTLALRMVACDSTCWVGASKDITLVRGVNYNAAPSLTMSCWSGRGTFTVREQVKFAGGLWDVSNTKTFTC